MKGGPPVQRNNVIMKFRSLTYAICGLLFTILTPLLNCEQLGHGYHIEQISEPTNSSFEQIAHHDALFFHKTKLGDVGRCFISPSGRFALFESGGKLLLFDAHSKSTSDVTDGTFAIPMRAEWSRKLVNVTYYTDHAPSKIKLPR